MARTIGKEIEGFIQRAHAMGATPVLKLFMIPTPELRRTRCELCGRVMQVNLQGTSRPVCWYRECPSNALCKGEAG